MFRSDIWYLRSVLCPTLSSLPVGCCGINRLNFHYCPLHLHPLIEVMVKPNNSYRISPVKVAIVTVLVPPASGVKLGTMSAAYIIVSIHRAERHEIGVFQSICAIAMETIYEKSVIRGFFIHTEIIIVDGPVLIVEVPHVDVETVLHLGCDKM